MGLQPTTTSLNPVSLADVKTHLRIVNDIDPNTSSDDAALTVFLAAAFEFVETETRQQLLTRTYVLTLDAFPDQRGEIVLPCPPLGSVGSVQYVDSAGSVQTFGTNCYMVDSTQRPGRLVLKPGLSWPATDGSAGCVRIQFTAGYGTDPATVPAILKQCILLLAGHFYENREGAIDRRIDEIPLGVRAILNQQMFPTAVG